MNISEETIQFITYPVRLSGVLDILISTTAVYLKALSLASGHMALALVSKVQALRVEALASVTTSLLNYVINVRADPLCCISRLLS